MPNQNNIKSAQQRMEQFTHEFPADLRTSLQIAEENPIKLDQDKIQNIVICGMGGSGIGGMIAKDILQEHITKPIDFCKGYDLPNYVNEHSLVICSSYSGDTEETLALFEQAVAKKAQIISICSGGELCDKSTANDHQTLIIQGGKQPRAAVGLSLVQQLHILGSLFLDDKDKAALLANVKDTASVLKQKSEQYQKNANAIARDLHLKHITLFTDTQFPSIATRFTQQINENVKKKAHSAIIPEMNHNELVAFKDYTKMDTVLLVNTKFFNAQNSKRVTFLKQELSKQDAQIIEINAEGDAQAERYLKMIYMLDLVSIELAKIKDVDPEEIEAINNLKQTISK